MPATPFEVSTDAGPIAGKERGGGPGLLMLHGGPGFGDYMEVLGDEVTGWRAVHYQQRGLLPSTAEGPFTIARHVADAVAVLDARGMSRAVVLGHSWGGHLAMHLALAHPGRVAGLLLVDPLGAIGDGGIADVGRALPARLPADALRGLAEAARQLAGAEPSDADAARQLALLWPGYFAEPAAAPAFPPQLGVSQACNAATFASVSKNLAAGFASELGGIGVPVIFLLGAQSPMPVSQGQQTAALMPSAEVQVILAAGHLPWHERPGCVAAALTRLHARIGDLPALAA